MENSNNRASVLRPHEVKEMKLKLQYYTSNLVKAVSEIDQLAIPRLVIVNDEVVENKKLVSEDTYKLLEEINRIYEQEVYPKFKEWIEYKPFVDLSRYIIERPSM